MFLTKVEMQSPKVASEYSKDDDQKLHDSEILYEDE